MKTPAKQFAEQLAWFNAMGITRFDLAIRRADGTWVHPHQDLAIPRLRDMLAWCRSENARGSDIYLRPHRGRAWPLIFLDDVVPAVAASLSRAHPALVLETSPGRCHVWLRTSRALTEAQRAHAQRTFIASHHVDGLIADPRSCSGEHFGRAAGFRNRKPGRDCWVNLRCAATGGSPISVAPAGSQGGSLGGGADLSNGRGLPCAAGHALHELADQPARHAVLGNTERVVLSRQAPRDQSESGREWGLVMRALEAGKDPEAVRVALADLARPRRGRDAERYAELTVTNAVRVCSERRAAAAGARQRAGDAK